MKWVCQSIPMTKLIVSSQGLIQSKCETCRTKDCSHQIEIKDVAVFGVTKKMKCLVRNGDPSLVVQCQGYTE